MRHTPRSDYLRGITLSASGMAVLSPDALLLRLIAEASLWDVIFYRTLFMGISLAVVLYLRYRARLGRLIAAAGWAFPVSAALLAGGNLCFVGAITHTTVTNTLVILATMPLFSAVLGKALIGEAVQPRTWGAIVLAIIGAVVIFSDSLTGGNWLGDLLAAATAFLQGLNLVVLRKAGQQDMTPALALSGFLAAFVCLPLATPAAVNAHDMTILALLGFLILPLALALFFSGTRTVPAAEVALLSLVETVLGPLWVWIGVGEVPSLVALLGGAIVVAAIAGNAAMALRAPPPKKGAPDP